MSRPRHHANSTKSLFQNPWETPEEIDDNTTGPAEPLTDSQTSAQERSWMSSFTNSLPAIPSIPSLLSNIPLEWARDLSEHGISPIKVLKPEFSNNMESDKSMKATWLGHSSYLVELPRQSGSASPIRILFDPMFSDRAGPSPWMGIRRRLHTPCTVAELPEINYLAISHNHYDHLDFATIQVIIRLRGQGIVFLVPLGVKSLLLSLGIQTDQIHELDWWDEIALPYSSPGSSSEWNSVTFTCVPAQHASGRNMLDKCTTLWCGWVVKQDLKNSSTRIYHAGDTGYLGTNGPCPVFKEIGQRCGPFDLAMLPIWRGGTLSFVSQMGLRLTHHPLLSAMHASPADAVAIHLAVRSRHSLAMHFGTFAGSEAEALEPLVELSQSRREAKLGDWFEEGGIGAIDVGQTVEISVSVAKQEDEEG